MRAMVIVGICLLVAVSPVFGQAGSIGLFADPAGSSCSLADVIPGPFSVYVIHVYTPGATGSHWAVRDGAGFGGTWLSDTLPFIIIWGCSHCPEGVSTGYGGCFASPIHIATINYFGMGTSAPCTRIDVVPADIVASGHIEVVDCSDTVLAATGGSLIINPTEDCQCDVPARATTWGAIKSMYEPTGSTRR